MRTELGWSNKRAREYLSERVIVKIVKEDYDMLWHIYIMNFDDNYTGEPTLSYLRVTQEIAAEHFALAL